VAVTTAICLVFLIGFVALVLDVGHLQAVRNEVQNAADAAALAGTRALFPYQGYPDTNLIPIKEPPFCPLALTTAKAAASENHPGAIVDMAFAPGDVETGIWDWTNKTFTAQADCTMDINAVRVTIRKDAVANQPVATWFASIIGIDTVNVNAQAVAAVGYINGYGPGPFPPMWIPTTYWDSLGDNARVKAYNDPSDLFAWAAPDPESANASYLKDAINGDLGSAQLPQIGDTANLSNGLLGSIHMLIDKMINREPYSYTYVDETNATVTITGWLTAVMVGDRTDGSDPTKMVQQGTIDQIVPILITAVDKPSAENNNQWAINFTKLPEKYTMIGSPTGPTIGQIYATQPRLVQ
jgi:hypothetical protein